MLPLHEIALDDLNCSNQLWATSPLNPDVPRNTAQKVDIVDLMGIHPEQDHPSGLLGDEWFNAWKFLHDLLNYGPEAFRKHKVKLGDPEVVDAIPTQVPNTALDVV